MPSGMDCRFFCVRAGTREISFEQVGELRTLELTRSRGSVRMEKDLEFDTLFWRHGGAIRRGVGAVSAGRDPHHGAERAGDVWGLLCVGDEGAAGGFVAYESA